MTIIRWLLILVVLSLTSCTTCSTWKPKDKALAGTFMAGQFVNYGQINNPGWNEINPILEGAGKTRVLAWKVASTGIMLKVADAFPEYRTSILIICNTVLWSLVSHDLIAGVGWQW